MRDKIEQIKQAVAAGQMPRAQGADMIGRIVQAEDPELFAGLSAQNAQNKMQQAAASQAGGGAPNLVGQSGVPGPVQFQRPSPQPSTPLTPKQTLAQDERIMDPSYNNTGVNMQMQKNFSPWQGGQTPMAKNTNFQFDQLGGGPLSEGQQPIPGPARNFNQAELPYAMKAELEMQKLREQQQGQGPSGLLGQGKGMLSQGLNGLRGMGKSLGGYTKSLFDDPSRMALLQGGLSMMDPNTYYDKDNFGSVFTGLNKGLGAAQQGHAGVLARRKSVADTFKAKAEADYAASGKGGEGQNEFRRVLAKYNDPNTSAEDKKWLGGRLEKLSQPGTDFDVKGMRNYIWETAFPSNTQLSETLDTFVNTMNSTVDTDAGIDFGPGSEFKSSVYAVLSETFGQDLGDKGQRAANTRAYMSSMGIQVGQTIKLFGAGTGLSDADLKFAKDITGQDPGSFSKASLEMLLVLNEGQMRGKLLKANKVMNSMYGGKAPEHMLQELPPMTKNLQKHIAKEMKKPKGWVVKGEKVTEKPDGWNDTYEGQWDNLVAGRPDKPTTAAVSAKKQRMSGWTFTVND